MVGKVAVGGGAPISVQSMTKTDTRDYQATIAEIERLEKAGCEIVRLAIPDQEAIDALGKIRKRVSLPLIADIHFDYRLAIASLKKGIDGLRINPGNIGSREKVREVVKVAKERQIPIRIGVNSGSLEKEILRKHGGATPEAMVESALKHVRILEEMDFGLIKISLKAPDIYRTLRAYRLMAEKVEYPFHAGITEAGFGGVGIVKSAVGLALLLSEGLADTIRVSLTSPPEEEVKIGISILRSMGLRPQGLNLISCPGCGRTEVDFFPLVKKIEESLSSLDAELHLAVMGCMVNGPGEAKEALLGIAFGREAGVMFKKGRVYRRVKKEDALWEFIKEAKRLAEEKGIKGKR